MGTPAFSLPTLQTLIDSSHEVVAVYTQPDRPSGRGNKVVCSEVKQKAIDYQLPIYQPAQIKQQQEVQKFRDLQADVAVVIAYGQILPREILEAPKHGCINIHGSLLPKYRGASPIQAAILEGEPVTGLTTMMMDEGMDTGAMLLRREIPIAMTETAQSLHDKLAALGGELILETLDLLENGRLISQPQDDYQATKTSLLTKEMGRINWRQSAVQIERQVRAYNPWPTAYTYHMGKQVKVWGADIVDEAELLTVLEKNKINLTVRQQPGHFIVDGGSLYVICGQQALKIKELQMQGKRRMTTKDFLNGMTFEGEKLFVS